MRITSFMVGASRTFNLGNFESLRVEASVTTELLPDDEVPLAKSRAEVELRELLTLTYRNMTQKNDKLGKS